MGIDGFSMGALGLNTDLSSTQLAAQADIIADKEFEIKVKDVDESAEEQAIKEKNHQKDKNKKDKKQQNQDSDFQDEEEENDSLGLVSVKDFENNPKEFGIRINTQTEMIELYSTVDKRIMETISADDLMHLIAKLDSASGILVNRKI